MVSMTTQAFKKKLEDCIDYEDIFSLMRVTPKYILEEFVHALEKAKEFIELSMKDDCLLNTAKGYLVYKN